MTKKAIVGRKVGMTQVWDDDNKVVPVTVVEVPTCRVVDIKTTERNDYQALAVSVGDKDPQKVSKPVRGQYDKAGVAVGESLVELRLEDVSGYEIGQELTCEIFSQGEIVDATASSKGKGFAGVMKRHNFAGQRATHGAHLVHRMPGSVGQCATPARIFKGKKMAGRLGGTKVTTQNLEIVRSDPERNVLLIKGSVPGPKGGSVLIRNGSKKVMVDEG